MYMEIQYRFWKCNFILRYVVEDTKQNFILHWFDFSVCKFELCHALIHAIGKALYKTSNLSEAKL